MPTAGGKHLRIKSMEAFPISMPIKDGARLSIGRATKRDSVVVRVETEDGIVGYGESHHARAPNITAAIVNTTLQDIILPANAEDITGIWARVYHWQLRSHGLGAAMAMAMSGIDMALWDIAGKAAGKPLHVLLGSEGRPIKAYAGGVALGWQEPESLVDEAAPLIEAGFKAVKLRMGDAAERDIARVRAVRAAFGDGLAIMLDANTGYDLDDARRVIPAFEELGVVWLEEPFPPHDWASYAKARQMGNVPLAAGENHYTRFEFSRLFEERLVEYVQADLSKAGGVTEAMRIAHTASTWKIPFCPHSSMTGLNMAASIHLLMAVDNAGYFEADVSKNNLFRTELTPDPYRLHADGTVTLTSDAPGIGLDVDEGFVRRHGYQPGRNFV